MSSHYLGRPVSLPTRPASAASSATISLKNATIESAEGVIAPGSPPTQSFAPFTSSDVSMGIAPHTSTTDDDPSEASTSTATSLNAALPGQQAQRNEGDRKSTSAAAKKPLRINLSSELTESARLWISEDTYATIGREGGLTICYNLASLVGSTESQSVLPSPAPERMATIVCCYDDDYETPATATTALRNLTKHSLSIERAIRSLGHDGNAPVMLNVGRIDFGVVQSALGLLEHGELQLELPSQDKAMPLSKKLSLLQMTDLAHKLGIEELERVALYTLCIAILRRPRDWTNDFMHQIAKLVTSKGNSAISLIKHLSDLKGERTVPWDKARRDNFWKMEVIQWQVNGKGELEPVEDR
ncbi:hypothetical protein H2200_001435 [Cladophialophora chaetospira]|uniref:Uncharacterized protein n=1 Tax=Cladophialophora chaetospira TaxID=386627 RepID=A0AA38XL57_9EURO|nr:hypothetical protein H2200_001435 [Cladophialophora chaetospira]